MEASQHEVEKTPNNVQETVFSETSAQPQQEVQQTIDLSDVAITNENIALNVIVSYVNIAQKRGAFNIKESAKIWECIQKFQRVSP